MKTNRAPLLLFGTLALILVAAIWYVLRPSESGLNPASSSTESPLKEEVPSASNLIPSSPGKQPDAAQRTDKKGVSSPMPVPKTEIAQWEYRIDEALRSQADHSAIALSLLSQVPAMPGEGQTAAAQHIVNLIADKDYLQVLPYIKNPRMETGFQEIIVAESLNRPDEVKLPVLLTAARTPKHPMAETAVSVLSVLLDANHGTDWSKWEEAVNKALNKVTPTPGSAAVAENSGPTPPPTTENPTPSPTPPTESPSPSPAPAPAPDNSNP